MGKVVENAGTNHNGPKNRLYFLLYKSILFFLFSNDSGVKYDLDMFSFTHRHQHLNPIPSSDKWLLQFRHNESNDIKLDGGGRH